MIEKMSLTPPDARPVKMIEKLNEVIEALNQLGQFITENNIIWGDKLKPDGWKW